MNCSAPIRSALARLLARPGADRLARLQEQMTATCVMMAYAHVQLAPDRRRFLPAGGAAAAACQGSLVSREVRAEPACRDPKAGCRWQQRQPLPSARDDRDMREFCALAALRL